MTLCTLFVLSLLLIIMVFKKTKNCRGDFLKYLNLSCFIFFNFGYQVHEKAIITNVIILSIHFFLTVEDKRQKEKSFTIIEKNFLLLTVVGTISQFPLINSIREFPILVLLMITYIIIITLAVKNE